MLPAERKKQIKAWILEKKSIKISYLSEWLGVSEMTIHRDLKPLIEEGLIAKTFGGITLVDDQPNPKLPIDSCAYCSKQIRERLAYRLILANQEIKQACCAHCGLMLHEQYKEEAVQALCKDFLTETTISAGQGWYVFDTSLDIGCCEPQVLIFGQHKQAEKFVKGFGGEIYNFNEASKTVHDRMNMPSNCCKKHK